MFITVMVRIFGGMVALYLLMCFLEMAVKRRMAGRGAAHSRRKQSRLSVNYDYSRTQMRGNVEWYSGEDDRGRYVFNDSGRRTAAIRGSGAECLPEASYYDDYDEDEDAEDTGCHDSYDGSAAFLAAENACLRRRLEEMEGRVMAWPR